MHSVCELPYLPHDKQRMFVHVCAAAVEVLVSNSSEIECLCRLRWEPNGGQEVPLRLAALLMTTRMNKTEMPWWWQSKGSTVRAFPSIGVCLCVCCIGSSQSFLFAHESRSPPLCAQHAPAATNAYRTLRRKH